MKQFGINKNKGKLHKKNNKYKKAKEKVLSILDEKIAFSFKYLNFSNPKFTVSECGFNYFFNLIRRFKDLGNTDMSIFMEKYARPLRNHRIDWEGETVTEDGFGLNLKQDILDEPWQFSVSSNEHGRVHGFIIQNIFYVVWLDPEHNLDIGKKGQIDQINQSPRKDILEDTFKNKDINAYFKNQEDIDLLVSEYEKQCQECEWHVDRVWHNCVFCNEDNDNKLLEIKEAQICYDCLNYLLEKGEDVIG